MLRDIPKLTLTAVCSAYLAACSHNPAQNAGTAASPGAVELASVETARISQGGGLRLPMPAVTEAVAPMLDTAAPQQINQSGSLPAVGHSQAPDLRPQNQYFPTGQEPVSLDYEQTELRQILEELADILGISMVIDSSIAAKVTLRTAPDKPLRPADIWPTLQLLLADNGISMEQKGKVYHLKREPSALPAEIGGVNAGLSRSDAPEVMQVTPLRYISVDAGMAALRPLVEPQGRLLSLPTLNLLGIISAPSRLPRVNNLLSLIDADPFVHRGMRLFRLNNAKASEVQGELDKILKAVEGNMPSYQLISLERINSILAVGPPQRGFGEVERWVSILDEKNEEGGEQVFIYRVRNLKATTLATTLNEIFKDDDKDGKSPRRDTRPAAETNPLLAPQTLEQVAPPSANSAAGSSEILGGVSAKLKINLVADEDTNTLIIRTRPRDYRQLLETIAVLDQVPKEVMVNVVVAEVSLTEATRFGIEWGALLGNNRQHFVGTNFGIAGATSNSGTPDFSPNSSSASLTGLVINAVGNRVSSILNLIANDNDVKVLSRPSILVRNNQEATMNVGSEEPTITRVNTTTQNTVGNAFTSSNEIQYRQTGIILKVTPHINEDGIINMEVSQEVSSLGAVRTEQKLPSFSQRKFETSLLVRDGSAIILGGLIETRQSRTVEGVPGLMDLPLVGPLFSNTSKDQVRTELVVIIIPEIVNPAADNHAYVEAFKQRMKAVSSLLNEDGAPVLLQNFTPTRTPTTPPEPGVL